MRLYVNITGFGKAVIERLKKTTVKKNLYWELKEHIISETNTGFRITKDKQIVRVFGLDSTKEVRARLIEILYDRVHYHKDKFVSKLLHHELSSMEVKTNGKVEHSSQTHDDQVFSYLMALYVWYDGKNIMENFGIQKNTIMTDDSVEVVDSNIEAEEGGKEKIDFDKNNIVDEDPTVQEQMMYIGQAGRFKLGYVFNNELYQSEQDMFDFMLATNRAAKEAYDIKYHNDTRAVQGVKMVTLPDSVFADDEDYQRKQEVLFHGNLYDQWNNLN